MRTGRLTISMMLILYPALSSGQALPAPTSVATPAIPTPAAPAAAPVPYDRFHEFIHNTIKSPAFHLEALGAALIDQVAGFPKEWDAEGDAFLKRSAARFGQSFTSHIMEAGGAQALHYHVGYERCGCSGSGRRLGHAVAHTFVVRHVDGHLVFNTPFVVSRYGAAAIASAWFPESYKAGDVVTQGTTALGFSVGLNILDEFAPELLHLVHH
jgi:hypothetical protein